MPRFYAPRCAPSSGPAQFPSTSPHNLPPWEEKSEKNRASNSNVHWKRVKRTHAALGVCSGWRLKTRAASACRTVVFLSSMEELPQTNTGKIQKNVLREIAQSLGER